LDFDDGGVFVTGNVRKLGFPVRWGSSSEGRSGGVLGVVPGVGPVSKSSGEVLLKLVNW